MSFLLNLTYLLILLLASPVLLYRRFVGGKYRDGWSQKFFGRLPAPAGDGPRVWFHAVSVGEVLQLETVVAEIERRRPDIDVVITTTTSTGLAVAKDKFPRRHVCYFPLDFSWAVRNAVERIRPDAVVLVELELWPNFIRAVRRREIPLLLINGRISETSFRGYRRIRFLMRGILNRFDRLAMQNDSYAERLRNLGAPPERITVTGSLKFDGIQTDRNNPRTRELRDAFGLSDEDTVFIAGSTHAPEEEIALQTWCSLRDEFPQLRLLLVPRHKERFDEVAKQVESHGLPVLRRSEIGGQKSEVGSRKSAIRNPQSATGNPVPVLLLDTLGELSACWGLADIAFVGGSLTRRGGQNMIEPAGYGAAVLFGPNTGNFRDVVDMLRGGNAAHVVNDPGELTETVRRLLKHSEERQQLGRNAQRVVLTQQGAVLRTVEMITAFFGESTISSHKPSATRPAA